MRVGGLLYHPEWWVWRRMCRLCQEAPQRKHDTVAIMREGVWAKTIFRAGGDL